MRRMTLAMVVALSGSVAGGVASGAPKAAADEALIRKVEDDYRQAKLANDLDAIGRCVADEYYAINKNGNARDRAQLLDLWKQFKIKALTVDVHRVRITGDIAVVAGRERETGACGGDTCPSEAALFLRTYVRRRGRWLILSAAQFRDPKADGSIPKTSFPHDPF